MAEGKKDQASSGSAALGKALLSVGADKDGVEKLLSSKSLEGVVIPIYWKDGLVSSVRPLWLIKLPEFLRGFKEEFPDGQVNWDDGYGSSGPGADDVALRVYFNYQEDDQGNHWSPPPTLLEEESYYRMLARAAFKGKKQVSVGKVLRAR